MISRFAEPRFRWWRRAAAVAAALLGVWLALAGCSWLLAPGTTVRPIRADDEAAVVAARERRPDPARPNVLWRDVDYARGAVAEWFPKGESPLAAELVRAGTLPPVAERVGPEPLVLGGVEGIGRYGGVWVEGVWASTHLNIIDQTHSYANLVRWSPEGFPIVPHVAKGWKVNADQTVYTFFLRRGMKWSDGVPFTADDILYWYEAEVLDPAVGGGGDDGTAEVLQHTDRLGIVRKLDDYTVEFVFTRPNGLFLQKLASVTGRWPVNCPKHYLQPYHPRLGDPELIKRTCAALGLPSAAALYRRLKRPDNPQHPRLWPWIYRTYRTTPPFGFVRNPYYFAVDPAGNQLPYFDRLQFEVKSPELLGPAAASGELTLQTVWPPQNNYTLLLSGRAAHGYSVRQWYNSARSAMVINPNLNRKVLPEDPASRWKQSLLADKRFRQALSLALDRRAIIATAFLGLGTPSQVEPGEGSPFHSEKLAQAYTGHDPARANALLDAAGLTGRDGEGLRTFPDGTRMEFYLHTIAAQDTGAMQLIVDDWARVGVRAKVLVRSQNLWRTEISGLVHDFSVAESLGEFIPTVVPRPFVPWGVWCDFAQGYSNWFMKGGMTGDPRAAKLGTQGPPAGDPIRRAMELYNVAREAPTLAAQAAAFREIFDLAAENVWTINIATPPPYLVLVKDGVRNVPQFAVAGNDLRTPGNAGLETFFFDAPAVAPAALAHMRSELAQPAPALPGSGSAMARVSPARAVLGAVLALAATIAVLVIALRHPFIGRRLALMVPTLAVISVLSFVIIQLPPGDYLTTLIIKLQEEGGEASEAEIRDFRVLYHLDQSPVQQYLQWSGLKWFTTFRAEDRGLLQGDLGRSMETQRPVNEMIGDRTLLTIVITLGTILFTWTLAIPIGIYSAVKQYSPGDYLATFAGLVAMSVPNFLLAVIVMFVAAQCGAGQVTGLFSPAFAVQPGWTTAKVLDLFKHLWVPVVILGVSGVAAMVRVLRGNLLDELHKPYVRTARAKGMAPWRLVLKYPVRLALNPFVSGLGALVPQLISGGAITAVILSLPTVGPLMLDAFRSEDMYLAGSLLMILSFLGIAGTLTSDLLLLALDPRIRMGQAGPR